MSTTSNVIIASYSSFNQRRYGTPWVCTMTPAGKYDFSQRVGTYTGDGDQGEAGDLVVTEPVEGQVYGYGQKDYRAITPRRSSQSGPARSSFPATRSVG